MKHLVLGGARSGKSGFAEQCVLQLDKPCFYVATAQAGDEEMSLRIERHQARRDQRWTLLEEPVHLANSLQSVDAADRIILVDCLTLWLSNCLHLGSYAEEKRQLLQVLGQLQADIVLVCNDVGSGVVPMGELSRRFVDESGWLQQDVARLCSHVSTVIAGLPLVLKAPDS